MTGRCDDFERPASFVESARAPAKGCLGLFGLSRVPACRALPTLRGEARWEGAAKPASRSAVDDAPLATLQPLHLDAVRRTVGLPASSHNPGPGRKQRIF